MKKLKMKKCYKQHYKYFFLYTKKKLIFELSKLIIHNISYIMESIIKYLTEKKIKAIDITSSVVDPNSYEKYVNIAKKNPNIMLYFKKNEKNKLLFHPSITLLNSIKVNYTFLYQEKYVLLNITNKFNTNIKRVFDKFIEDDIECKVCFEPQENIHSCYNCAYNICDTCCKKLDKQTDEIIKCPNCRQSFESYPSSKRVEMVGKISIEDAKKMGMEKGGVQYDENGNKLVFLTRKQVEELGLNVDEHENDNED